SATPSRHASFPAASIDPDAALHDRASSPWPSCVEVLISGRDPEISNHVPFARPAGSRSIGGMCPNLAFKPVDGADAETYGLRHLDDADALRQLQAGALELLRLDSWPAKPSAQLARLALELPVAGELVLDDAQPCSDPLADHRTLKFSESTCNLEQELARRCGGVDALLIQVE